VSAPAKDSFLESLLAAVSNFDGHIFVLNAFFDETGTNQGHRVTAVAGFLFDEEGLQRFNNGWNKIGGDLKEPYRTYDCANRKGQFENNPEWPPWRCDQLMGGLAVVSSETRIAGFIASTQQTDFAKVSADMPGFSWLCRSIYSVAVLQCLDMVGWFARQRGEQDVHYWFESGDEHEEETRDIVKQASLDPILKKRFRYGGDTFVPKGQLTALYSSDQLGWEWQSNYIKLLCAEDNVSVDSYTESVNFKTLCGNDGQIFIEDMGQIKLAIRGITHAWHHF
jgi:hypothetical protein